MQKVVVEKIKHLHGKTSWEVKPSDTEQIGDEQFIKLPRGGLQYGFTRLCLEQDGRMPVVDKGFSLTSSEGYLLIMEARTAAQADSLVSQQRIPELFKLSLIHI